MVSELQKIQVNTLYGLLSPSHPLIGCDRWSPRKPPGVLQARTRRDRKHDFRPVRRDQVGSAR
jgi:hypothetical protein